MTNKLLTYACIALGTFTSLAQEVKIKIAEPVKIKGLISQIMPAEGDEFYVTREKGPYTYFEQYDNLNVSKSKQLTRKINDEAATHRGSVQLTDRTAMVYSYRSGDENKFVLKTYDANLQEMDQEDVASQPFKKRLLYRSNGSLSYTASENKKYLFTWLRTSDVDADRMEYEYKIFGRDLEVLQEGDFEIPFDTKYVSIKKMYVGDDGKLYAFLNEMEDNDEKGVFKAKIKFKQSHVMRVDSKGTDMFKLELEDKSISSFNTFVGEDGKMYLTGLYTDMDENARGVDGLFYAEADFDKLRIVKETYSPFEDDFITQGWSDRQKKKADKKKSKGKGAPQLYKYYLRDLSINKKTGNIIGVAEQYYVVVRTYTDSKGNTRTTYTYYYNDMITFKINKDGDFDWVNKIKKTQISTNDGGYLSSYASFETDDKLFIFYNDSEKNYTLENGEYVDQSNPKYAGPGRKKNVVTLVEIDLETGEFNREMMLDRADLTSKLVPKKCRLDKEDEEMILFFQKGKKKIAFGNLSY